MTEATDVQKPVELVPGTPEYDAAMIAKSDAANGIQTPPAAPVKPEAVPEKFWDADKGVVNYEAWAASTKELEAKFTQAKQGDEKKPAEGLNVEVPADDKAAADALQAVGLNMDEFSAEFAEKGELSPESFAKLEKAGIGKDMVDAYIEGQIALQEKYDAKGYAVVGGQDKFAQMTEWAVQNMTRAELVAFNDAVNSRDEAKMLMAVRSMKASYDAASGVDPKLVGGGGEPTVNSFRSRAELTSAMKDPRYETDPAYRADVIAKLDATDMAALKI